MATLYDYENGTITLVDDADPERTKVLPIEGVDMAAEELAFFGPPEPASDADPARAAIDQMLADNLISVNRHAAMVAVLAL